jgi:hypothetical protein
MDENTGTPGQSSPSRPILLTWLDYLKRVFLLALAVAGLIGVSFVFTGGFSAQAYSDRLFMSGVIITFIGVFIFITIAGTRKGLGIPTIARNEEEARKLMENTLELSAKAEKRYDAGSQVWVIGVICVVLSVVCYYLLSALGI